MNIQKNYFCFFIVFLTFASCKQKKILPEPYIKTPVTFMESRVYSSFAEQVSKDGRIVSYTDYMDKTEKEFDENGYLLRYQNEHYSKLLGHESSQDLYEYDFSNEEQTLVYENNTLVKAYNREGKIAKTYYSSGELDDEYYYDEDGKLIKNIKYNYDDSQIDYEWVYEYTDKTKIAIYYDYDEEGNRVKKDIKKTFYDDKGVVKKTEDYYHKNNGEEFLDRESIYRNGNEIKSTSYSADGTNYYVELEYNSHDEVMLEVLYGSSGFKSIKESRREYDQYGNPTLVVNYYYRIDTDGQEHDNRYSITIYNYTYNDGSKFIAKENFPEIFGGSINKNHSVSTDSEHVNSSSHTSGGYAGGYSGGYVGGYNNDINYGSSTTMQDHEAEKRDILNRTVGKDCPACKGTGKCPTCNGTKLAHGFGNTYECTVCDRNGNCSVCHGSGKTSWN